MPHACSSEKPRTTGLHLSQQRDTVCCAVLRGFHEFPRLRYTIVHGARRGLLHTCLRGRKFSSRGRTLPISCRLSLAHRSPPSTSSVAILAAISARNAEITELFFAIRLETKSLRLKLSTSKSAVYVIRAIELCDQAVHGCR